jgi:hypothetical protein
MHTCIQRSLNPTLFSEGREMLDEMAWIQYVPGIIKNVRALMSSSAGINDRIRN